MANNPSNLVWKKINPEELPEGNALATNKTMTEFIIGFIGYEEDEGAVYCEQSEGTPITLYDPTHYISISDLKALPKEE